MVLMFSYESTCIWTSIWTPVSLQREGVIVDFQINNVAQTWMHICFPLTVCYTLLESKLDMSLVSIMFLTSGQGCGTFILPRYMHRAVLHVTLWTARFRRVMKHWNVDRNRPDPHKWRPKVLVYWVLFPTDYLTAVNTSDTITWSAAIRDTVHLQWHKNMNTLRRTSMYCKPAMQLL
jgi:hypothetical protein